MPNERATDPSRGLSRHPKPQSNSPSSFETSPVCTFGEVSKAVLQHFSSQFQLDKPNGTQSAINYSRSGVAADSEKRSLRGGAHNSAARQSHALSDVQIGNLKAAERFTNEIGLPFTRMITIHWEAAGVALEQMAKATGRFIDLLSKTLARHGGATAWLWVHENGDRKGGHAHILAHVPPELAPRVSKLQRGWLRSITGKPYRKRVIRSKPIGGLLGLERRNPTLHAVNREEAVAYVLKGASQAAAEKFSLNRLEPGGLVIGKRCGVSQNIGPKARASANS